MSSMYKYLLAALALGSASCAAAQDLTREQRAWYANRLGVSGGAVGSVPQSDQLGEALLQWRRLQQSDNLPFNDYARFLVSHPDWPGADRMRRIAEQQIDPQSYSPASLVAYFERNPPVTASGALRYAEALAASGRQDEANRWAREAWRKGAFRSDSASSDEALVLTRFGSALSTEDHDTRFDRLLWLGDTSAAGRVLSLTSPARRDANSARLRLALGSDSQAGGAALADAGYVAARAAWLRNNNRSAEARQLLATHPALQTRPSEPEEWYEVLLTNARAAANDRQWSYAYQIASKVDDAFPAGTDISAQPLGVRDDYTSLVWLAGTTALWEQRQPAEAIGMFERYATAARTPQTRSKGFYWAGRSAEAAGRRDDANRYYEQAAEYYDYFYGQLAHERLRRELRVPAASAPAISDTAQRAFYERDLVRAIRMLGQLGAWEHQSAFLRELSAQIRTDEEHQLAAHLAARVGRPDLAVMTHRSARVNGYDATSYGYPTVPLPEGSEPYFALVHAIMRQESQFDSRAVSHANARGLMQFIPSTAQEVSRQLGLPYSQSRLTSDPQYNIRLGTQYIRQLYGRYNNLVLAAAAYNAGGGNVNRWIRENGDPRQGNVDILQWIEEIPYYETKNYVQRVLENAVMYDLLHPSRAYIRSPDNRLSRYLGKSTPG
ncbi:MAG: transglycosylase SLT domain-containing protein [Parasphingopyxis sp.]